MYILSYSDRGLSIDLPLSRPLSVIYANNHLANAENNHLFRFDNRTRPRSINSFDYDH